MVVVAVAVDRPQQRVEPLIQMGDIFLAARALAYTQLLGLSQKVVIGLGLKGVFTIMKAEQLQENYSAVLQDIAKTNSSVREIRPSMKLVFSRGLLDEFIEELDDNAERLQRLDQALSDIAGQAVTIDSRTAETGGYSALYELGNSVYMALYQGYQSVYQLRDRLNLYISLTLILVSTAIGLFTFLA